MRMSGLRSMLSRTTPSRSFSVPGPASARVIGRRRGPALPPAMAPGGRSRCGGLSAVPVPVLVLVPGEVSAVPVPVPGLSRRSRSRFQCRSRLRCRGSPTQLVARAAASVSRQRAVRRSDGSGWGRFRRGNGWSGGGAGGTGGAGGHRVEVAGGPAGTGSVGGSRRGCGSPSARGCRELCACAASLLR